MTQDIDLNPYWDQDREEERLQLAVDGVSLASFSEEEMDELVRQYRDYSESE